MLETTITLRARQARAGGTCRSPVSTTTGRPGCSGCRGRIWPATRPITQDELVYGYELPDGRGGMLHVPGLNDAVQIPGLTNAWTMPIKTRIDMLSTGIKTPVGIKVMGPDLNVLGGPRRRGGATSSRPATAPVPTPPAPSPRRPSAETISTSSSTATRSPATACRRRRAGRHHARPRRHERHLDRRGAGALPRQRPLSGRTPRQHRRSQGHAGRHARRRAGAAGAAGAISRSTRARR